MHTWLEKWPPEADECLPSSDKELPAPVNQTRALGGTAQTTRFNQVNARLEEEIGDREGSMEAAWTRGR